VNLILLTMALIHILNLINLSIFKVSNFTKGLFLQMSISYTVLFYKSFPGNHFIKQITIILLFTISFVFYKFDGYL